MSDDESRLIRQAKAGNRDAFAALYRSYHPKVYRYILFRVDSVATAEDLSSEVFVRLVDRIDQFDERGRPILAWLYTIARNLVSDHYRREGRAEQTELHDGLVDDTVDPSQAAHYSLLESDLAIALGQLTEEQRQVIMLRFFEDLDNAATARVLDKSVGAVKALQHRALAALARCLGTGEP